METLTLHPQNKAQLNALKAMAKALKINFDEQKSHYNAAFVADIKAAEKRGNYKTIDTTNVWASILSE